MEFQHFVIQSCLMLGIILLFSVSEGHKSFLNEYIAKPYFEKHENLVDSQFDNFIKDEITLGSCQLLKEKPNLMPRLLALHQNLIGEGSHRRLSSSIRLELGLSANSCEAIIVERLPSGVFADPFELQHLVHRRVFSDAAVFGDTNLELPSFRSNRSLVEVHMEISSGELSGNNKHLDINIELPLHARYVPLGQGFATIEFGAPNIFLHCNIEGNLHNQSCVFMPTDQCAKSQAAPIVWEVPCGRKEHAEIVSIVTFISAFISVFLIVLTSVCHSNFTVHSNTKQS